MQTVNMTIANQRTAPPNDVALKRQAHASIYIYILFLMLLRGSFNNRGGGQGVTQMGGVAKNMAQTLARLYIYIYIYICIYIYIYTYIDSRKGQNSLN